MSAVVDVEKVKSRIFPTLLKGLTVLCKEKPEDPVRYLAHWMMDNNPYRPRAAEPAEGELLSPFMSRAVTPAQ